MGLFHPEGQFILHWNKAFLLCSVVALCMDPLFLYIPIVDGTRKCVEIDQSLEIVLCVLRSFVDMIYIFHVIINFRTMCLAPSSRVFGRGAYVDKPWYVAKRYLKSHFIIDVFAALPIPQLTVLVIISTSYSKLRRLKTLFFYQYISRVIQTSLFYQKVIITSSGGFIDLAWVGAAFNLFLYVLASHVVGAVWYMFAIESELRCWRIACERHNCHSNYLNCGKGRVGDYGFLNTSCPLLERNEIKASTNFDFGIFLDALQTRVLETKDLRQKILYCSLWGLQSLSSLGQGLKSSTYYGEILFVGFIAAIGLVLFALLIGNMQKYLQSFSYLTIRKDEMKENMQEAENLMSHIFLPEDLRQRVRRHKQYKWKITCGVELDSLVKDLPRDLRRDIKRHLCLYLVKRVPVFEQMEEHILDIMCDRLKSVLYTEHSYLLREGDPVREMLFITLGKLESITIDGGRGTFSCSNLNAGDFFGEELVTWALNPKRKLPLSTSTVQTCTNVQAFALVADDLLFVVSQTNHSLRSLQHTLRHSSQQWLRWAACYIQAAWRRYWKRKHAKRWEEANNRLKDALATGSETPTLSFAASIYVSKFTSNASCIL